jgi:hypothetical protein
LDFAGKLLVAHLKNSTLQTYSLKATHDVARRMNSGDAATTSAFCAAFSRYYTENQQKRSIAGVWRFFYY